MPHPNRAQVRIPRRLWDEMMLALDQALGLVDALSSEITAETGERPGIVTRQVHQFGDRILTEARRREAGQ